jgi:hypothetical protein
MADPENHTLRVLIEFRDEFRQLRDEFRQFKADTEQRSARIEERLDHLTQSFSGMVMGNQFLVGGIQGRFERIEHRVLVREQERQEKQ